MNRAKLIPRLFELIVVTGVLLGFSVNAHATGTAAGTTISNSASIDYEVDGIAQSTVTSDPVTFLVDRKVDLTVSTNESVAVQVTPGSSNNVLRFTLTNTGNDDFNFDLSATAVTGGGAAAFGGNDNIDADTVNVYVESGATAGYQPAEDTATEVVSLAPDESVIVYIVAEFGAGHSNGDIASYHLLAIARHTDGTPIVAETGAVDPDVVQNVFADGAGSDPSDNANDAQHSAQADYVISTAALSVSKSSTVISDPVNDTTNPLSIPGAVVEYTITINNGAGGEQATNITVTDSLNTEITAGTIEFVSGSIRVTSPNINGGVEKALTDAAGDDEGDWNVTAANTVTVSGIALNAEQSATVKFRIEIQ